MDANMTARKKALTPKENTFARLYVETGNATEAYRQAYNHNGNDATACRGAHDVLHRPAVEAYVRDPAGRAPGAAQGDGRSTDRSTGKGTSGGYGRPQRSGRGAGDHG